MPTQNNARPAIDERTRILGLHRVLPMAYHQTDASELQEKLLARLAADENDAAAIVDMSMILQSRGDTDQALAVLREAIKIQRDFCVVHGDGTGLRILAFVTPGDFMANTPLDFLLNGSNGVLWLHYVDAQMQDLGDLPDHDVAMVAIGEAEEHLPVLLQLAEQLEQLDKPILNNDPLLITRLTRDGVSEMFAQEPSLCVPATHRFGREALQAVASGQASLGETAAGLDFPVIVRPQGTHAGIGMECLHDAGELGQYLAGEEAAQFFVAPFIDYRGPDGLFSKQRIVLIDGQPYASHLALSSHWKVHYLSAGMEEDAAKRAIEAEWMENFDRDFAVRHAEAFYALNRHIGLDYFGIDCAELPDGRLLVFELDVAMVVHDMDDVDTFPYKKVAMQKLFDAFVETAEKAAGAAA